MRVIDKLYMKRPFYGVPRMTGWLRELGHVVNHKRVERLMGLMGLQAVVPGPHTSRPHPEHRVYPYLLRGVNILELSNSLEAGFCCEALGRALEGACPDIFNTDQGAQFTSEEFTGRLHKAGVRISMDGRGRVMDNIFIERLWRSVKYEEIYLRDYADGLEAHRGLDRYFRFYNTERQHQSLGKRTPADWYFGRN